MLRKEEKQSQYILSRRSLDLHLGPCVVLGIFISKDGIQYKLLISILRIAEGSTHAWRWVVRSFLYYFIVLDP